MITRRDASRLVLSGTAALLLPLPSAAQSQKERERILGLWTAQLQSDLDSKLKPGCGGSFSVRDFRYIKADDGLEMSAIVRLDWPPGGRSRPFGRSGADPQSVYRLLRDDARESFRKAWPDCMA